MPATDPSFPGWKLLRIVPNDGGAGMFTDDTDWATTAADLPADASTGVQRYRSDNSAPVGAVEYFISAFTAAGVRVARGSATVTATPMQMVRRPEQAHGASKHITVDGVPTTSVVLDRPYQARIVGEVERFTVRLSDYTAIPGTAEHLRIYWRDV